MKKSSIFKLVFHTIIICTSILVVSLFGQFREMSIDLAKNYIIQCNQGELVLLAIAKEKELNKDYVPLEFSNAVSKEDQELFTELFEYSLLHVDTVLSHDPSLYYSIKDLDTNKEVVNKNATEEDGNNIFISDVVIKNGIVQSDGNLSEWIFDDLVLDEYIGNNRNYDYLTDEKRYELSEYYENGDIRLNMPKNMKIHYSLNQNVEVDSWFFDYLKTGITNAYSIILASILGVVSFVLMLMIFFGNYEIEKEMFPFKAIKNWKLEILFVLYSVIVTCLCIGCVEISVMLIAGSFNKLIPSTVQIGGVVLLWILTEYIIACALFSIKNIFKNGWNYFKENTILFSVYHFGKRIIKEILETDLSNPVVKKVVIIGLLNGCIVFVFIVLGIFGPFGVILSLVYFVFMMYKVCKKMNEIQGQYNELLTKSRQLEKGNFYSVCQDYGMFEEIGKSLDSIQKGFEKAVQEEVKSQNMKNELISNVSHDLKTPLTCIKNYITLLQDENLDEKTRKEYIKNLEEYTNRMQTSIQDLFDISKVNSQTIILNKNDLDLISLCEQVLFECEDSFQHKNLKIVNNLKGNSIVNLDGEKTVRILENLFVNISKYAMPNSRVYLDMQQNEESISLIFKNISEDAMNFTPDEIVERFVRGDKSRHETGSGLGLAIVKSFTEAQGGTFEIDIQGDLFMTILTFPLSSNEEE